MSYGEKPAHREAFERMRAEMIKGGSSHEYATKQSRAAALRADGALPGGVYKRDTGKRGVDADRIGRVVSNVSNRVDRHDLRR